MKFKLNSLISIFFVSCFFISTTSCYKDNIEAMYPSTVCDTTNITWTDDIQPLITQSCNTSGCHDASAEGGYDLRTYSAVKTIADNGILMQVIQDGTMPKNAERLDNCSISKIRTWVANGAPSN